MFYDMCVCTDDGNHWQFDLVGSCTFLTTFYINVIYINVFSFTIVLCIVDIRLLCTRYEENLFTLYFKYVNYLLILSLKILVKSCNYWEKFWVSMLEQTINHF